VDAGCKSLISICFSKIAGSLNFLGSKEELMACALCRYGVTDSGRNQRLKDTSLFLTIGLRNTKAERNIQ
jgi:hypothetical protein